MIHNFNLTFDKISEFVRLTHPFVDKRKLSKLYTDAGYPRLSITEDNTLRLMLDSRAFAYGYGVITNEAVRTREFRQALRLGQLSDVFNSYEGSEGKKAGVLDWISGIAGALGKLGDTASRLGDTYKGTNSQVSEAERLRAEAALAAAQSKSSLWLILGISGAVVMLVLIIVMLKR